MKLICTHRDGHALETLYDRYSSMVYGICLRMLRNTSDARDLLQDIFLHVWEKGTKFDGQRASLRSWLCLVTRSKALDILRIRRRTASREIDAGSPVQAKVDLTEIASSHPGPAADFDNNEIVQRLSAALLLLPDVQREILTLSWNEQLSQTEIAHKLQCPLGTVKTRMRQGMLALRETLKDIGQNNREQPDDPVHDHPAARKDSV